MAAMNAGSGAGRRLLVAGAGGHARVVAEAAEQSGWQVAGWIGPGPGGEVMKAIPHLGDDADVARVWHERAIDALIVAIGDNAARLRAADKLAALGPVRFAVVVHPAAIVAPSAVLGPGTFVYAGAIVNPGARLGAHCMITTASSVDHDCVLEDGVSTGPGARMGGDCTIGRATAIAIGAVVLHGRRIGAYTVVGAGALVTRDVPDNVVVYGSPAKVVRQRAADERYL
jgi:sugar O-acyltransferase (sialic acid O-acetyltransferase NeuD family)